MKLNGTQEANLTVTFTYLSILLTSFLDILSDVYLIKYDICLFTSMCVIIIL